MQVACVKLLADRLELGTEPITLWLVYHKAREEEGYVNRTLHPNRDPPSRYEGFLWQP